MPIYEYLCKNCGKITERIYTSISKAENEINCDECGKPAKKIVSLSRFKLKGFGWSFDGYDVTSNSVKNQKAEGREKWNEKKREINNNRKKFLGE